MRTPRRSEPANPLIQRRQVLPIIPVISREFSPPECHIGLGPLKKLTFVLVPEAAVDKDDGTVFAKYEIRASW